MNDYIESFKLEGEIFIENKNIYSNKIYVDELRKKVGIFFKKPNPFPKSIFENVAYGLKIQGIRDKKYIASKVEDALKQAALWDEVKDNPHDSALALSEVNNKVCIARALAVEPSIILMDEPTSALDPIATTKVENLIVDLKKQYTIIIVTHNMQQASRISDYTAFFYMGDLIEFDQTNKYLQIQKKKNRKLHHRKIWIK